MSLYTDDLEIDMAQENFTDNSMDFVKNLWGNMGCSLPGMVTPTFDIEELGKRIKDLKSVEGWLKMNLSMLQMTIHGLEMQSSTLTAVKAMGAMASSTRHGGEAAAGETTQAAMWPWNLMQQVREQTQQNKVDPDEPSAPETVPAPAATPKPRVKRPKKAA